MSEDMEKAQILHKLEAHFDVDKKIIEQLIGQIHDQEIVNNLERINRGLTVEDNYKYIFAAMPWVKNIHGLDQEQEKAHKEKYQVPDYSVLFENNQKTNFPVLVDVKSVKGDKKSCEIMLKQVRGLQSYSSDNRMPLLIAIYWEKFGFWTHNCLKNFEHRKNYKISMEDAFKNDISHIFGDLSYLLFQPFYRKTLFEKNGKNDVARHEEFGEIKQMFLSKDNLNYQEFSVIESAIIDSMIKMKQIKISNEGNRYEQIEIADELPMMIKLDNWILKSLSISDMDISYKINDVLITDYSRRFIIEMMKYLGVQVTYQIPAEKNECTEYFFNLAYKNSSILDNYYASK